MLFRKDFQPVLDIFDNLSKISKPDIFNGFVEDTSSYQSEGATLGQITTQYLGPLEAGVTPDLEVKLQQFMDKAKQAGLDKIQDGYKQQWLKYVDSLGTK